MRIEVTKSMLLDAIKNEPLARLTPGYFFKPPTYRGLVPDLTDCPRCMVGAFLGNIVNDLQDVKYAAEIATEGSSITFDGFNVEDNILDDLYDVVRRELQVDHGMNALSILFEGLCISHGVGRVDVGVDLGLMEKVRNEVYDFVLDEFPETMEVEVDGVKLKEGLAVRILED